MVAQIIDGNAIAKDIRHELAEEIKAKKIRPCLAVVLIGEDRASLVYVKKKQAACDEIGLSTKEYRLTEKISEDDLCLVLQRISNDAAVHGILVQLPLPQHINKFRIFDCIDHRKDVDVFTAYNSGLLLQNRPHFQPCTAEAVREMLVRSDVPIKGQNVVIINRSLIIGQPLAHMLMQNDDFANATVTVCHEFTKNIKEVTRRADIVVTAVGRPDKFRLTADMVRPGATIIDVAIIRQGKKLIGDVEFEEVRKVAGAISPVPGGVGPVTISQLVKNTIKAYELQKGKINDKTGYDDFGSPVLANKQCFCST